MPFTSGVSRNAQQSHNHNQPAFAKSRGDSMSRSFQHQLLSTVYHPYKCFKVLGRTLQLSKVDRLRILLYHDIAPTEHYLFTRQLQWLEKSWRFVSPRRFADMVMGLVPIHGSNLLLTFDDGYASNRVVADEVLEPMGIRALFFVVSDFIDIEDRQQAREFIAQRILPGSNAATLPAHLENMNWRDLEHLLKLGHSIGGHTRTHARLSSIDSVAGYYDEILGCADVIEHRLGIRVDHFAYTFGDITSISPEALAICRQRFRFVHSGLRGDNVSGTSPFALRRDAVTASDSTGLLGAFLEGAADFRYVSACAKLDSWARPNE